MKKNYLIRSANLNDLEMLLKIEQNIITIEREFDHTLDIDPISYYKIKDLIQSKKSEVGVIEIDNHIIGSGYAQIVKSKPYLTHKFHSYLGFMFVDPNHRGNGYNKIILNYLIQWSKDQGITNCILDVYSDNEAAINAYKKAGFKEDLVQMKLIM